MTKTVVCDGQDIAPSKIVCIGRNYAAHIEELGSEVPDEMVIFLKPGSAISDNLRAFHGETIHYEAEICFLCKGGEFHAVGFGLDLTKRELQNKLKAKGLPWERCKAFDGAALFSEFVTFDGDPSDLSVVLEIDGATVQSGGTDLMIYKPGEILKEISSFITLNDGDIVMTGTPKGVGPIKAGATFEGQIRKNGETIVSKSWVAK
jgi:2-keto-4-pentenoate hydratase/2-oxohepta-3-ene-1,7-dioic acid hydratase in catechol pathway